MIRPMSIGYFGALRLLHRAFARYAPGHRVHILIRFFTCPFLRTLDVIPKGGRVLDIGAGHGTYSVLALAAGAGQFVNVEPDTRKSLLPMRNPKVRWVAGFDECVRGKFDAVVLYDATHRIPLRARKDLYARAFERLAPGGTFVLKDLDPERPLKIRWARFQDWVSDSLLGVSMGQGFLYQTPKEVEETLTSIGFTGFKATPIDRGYPHPHIIYTARKPAP